MTIPLRELPVCVAELVVYLIEAIGFDADGQAIVVNSETGEMHIVGLTPRRRTGVVVHLPQRSERHVLPVSLAKELRLRCRDAGVTLLS